MSPQKSVVLVTVDCLRADHVGFAGYDQPTTPFLDALAGESFVFPAAIVAGVPTYYSFPAILGARAPLALGRDVLGLAPTEPTLASAFKQAGYVTAAFSAANPYVSARFGYEQGFDTFRDFLDHELIPANEEQASADRWRSRLNRTLHKLSRSLDPAARIYDELYFQYCQRWATPSAKSLESLRRFPAADVMLDLACSWLASVGQQPYFLWLHLMDPHFPYYPTEEALELMGRGGVSANHARYLNAFWLRHDLGPRRLARHRDDVVALYDAGIRWVDTQMKRLVDALRRFHLWENCILAVTGDHGEEFLDHGARYHPPSRLMEELIHVPLLLRVPGIAKKELPKSPFSLVELSPTLLDAARVPPPATFQSSSRWQKIQRGVSWDEPAVVECIAGCTNPFYPDNRLGPRVLAVREERYKLVLNFEPGHEQLYDLEADPQELAALPHAAERPVRRRLLQWASQHLEKSRRERDPALLIQARLRELRIEWTKPLKPLQTAGF
jgi:arylsulfatase A-like enzyme